MLAIGFALPTNELNLSGTLPALYSVQCSTVCQPLRDDQCCVVTVAKATRPLTGVKWTDDKWLSQLHHLLDSPIAAQTASLSLEVRIFSPSDTVDHIITIMTGPDRAV